MMDLQKIEQEKKVLMWGGLAGMLGSTLFILAMIWVELFVPPDPAELTGWVMRFPGIRAARVVENGLYLMGLIMGVPLFISVFWTLRRFSLAPALFGSALCILGLGFMMVSATPHVAHSPLSNLYHATGATHADQAAIALMWQATWGIFNAMLYVGFIVVPIGLFGLGIATFQAPGFGRLYGGTIVTLSGVGLVAAVFQMIYPASIIGAGSYFAILISYCVLGWKVYTLSSVTDGVSGQGLRA